LIPPNDVLTAEAQRSHRRGLLIQASNIRATADADLRHLIGGASAAPLEPVPPAAPASLAAAGAEPRPERRVLEHRLAAAQERESAAAAQFKPQVAASAGYDYARPNPRIFPRADRWDDSWDVSVNASWTLWDGGRRAAERAEAAAAVRALESRVLEFDRAAAFEVQARRFDVESAQAAIAAALDGIRAAEEARRVVAERYQAGVATNTDVLDAELAVLQAQLDHTRAVASSRLADARLVRALGLPTP
jgi:outer membrane protein TolC